jgi:hypothetical protein
MDNIQKMEIENGIKEHSKIHRNNLVANDIETANYHEGFRDGLKQAIRILNQ